MSANLQTRAATAQSRFGSARPGRLAHGHHTDAIIAPQAKKRRSCRSCPRAILRRRALTSALSHEFCLFADRAGTFSQNASLHSRSLFGSEYKLCFSHVTSELKGCRYASTSLFSSCRRTNYAAFRWAASSHSSPRAIRFLCSLTGRLPVAGPTNQYKPLSLASRSLRCGSFAIRCSTWGRLSLGTSGLVA